MMKIEVEYLINYEYWSDHGMYFKYIQKAEMIETENANTHEPEQDYSPKLER